MNRSTTCTRVCAIIAALTACSSPRNAASGPAAVDVNADLVRRGKELVQLGGCGDCHTPVRFDPQLGMPVPRMDRMLSGHPPDAPEPQAQPGQGDQAVIGATFTSFRLPFGVVYSSNLTPDRRTGLGSWTPEEFVRTMRTGHSRGAGRVLLPPMPWQNLSQQPDANLHAIFAYLRSIPAVENHVPEAAVPAATLLAIAESYRLAAKAQPAPL
jgi:hypothetical protein